MPDIEALWGKYDKTSAALVKAKRALREGRATEAEVLQLQIAFMDLGIELSARGEHPDPTEPGDYL